MGPFILGILVGWLAEWLFFNFWVKGKEKNDASDCSELLAQLRTKDKEIASLKASSSASSKIENKTESVASVVPIATKKAVKATTPAKPVAKKPPAKKAPAKKSATAKAVTTTKKPAVEKTEPKKTAPKKAVAKKVPAKKTTPVAKKSPAKKTKGDDLTKLSGIGPSMAATMAELGITSYKELSAMDDDILRDMLEASGARLNNNKDAMDSWNEQATLADNGDFAGLKKLQDELKG